MDLKSDLTNGDLLIENGDLQIADRKQSNGQRIFSRLSTFVGEWFLDLTFGIDYFADILIKNPQLQLVSGILKTAILTSADDGAIIETFTADFDNEERKLTTEYSARLDGGVIIDGSVPIQG